MPTTPTVFPFTGTVTSSYISGGIYIGIKQIGSGSFEQVNLGNPTVLFAIDPSVIPDLTGTLSASYSRSLW